MQRPCWAVLSSRPALGHANSAWQTDADAEGSLWTALSCVERGHPLRSHQGTVTGTALPGLSFHLSVFCLSERTGERGTHFRVWTTQEDIDVETRELEVSKY